MDRVEVARQHGELVTGPGAKQLGTGKDRALRHHELGLASGLGWHPSRRLFSAPAFLHQPREATYPGAWHRFGTGHNLLFDERAAIVVVDFDEATRHPDAALDRQRSMDLDATPGVEQARGTERQVA